MTRAITITAALLISSTLVGGMIAFAQSAKEPPTELYVRTVPHGAVVLVDGKRVGTSDNLFEIEPGERKIEVKLRGYEPSRKEVIVPASRIERVVFELKKRTEGAKAQVKKLPATVLATKKRTVTSDVKAQVKKLRAMVLATKKRTDVAKAQVRKARSMVRTTTKRIDGAKAQAEIERALKLLERMPKIPKSHADVANAQEEIKRALKLLERMPKIPKSHADGDKLQAEIEQALKLLETTLKNQADGAKVQAEIEKALKLLETTLKSHTDGAKAQVGKARSVVRTTTKRIDGAKHAKPSYSVTRPPRARRTPTAPMAPSTPSPPR